MKSVIKGAGYILVHTPDMVLHNGTTQTTERIVNPESEYLKELPSHIRSFDKALSYWPNQVYIGNKHPDELSAVEQPWCDKDCDVNDRFGPFGQIMPQEEFLLLMQACDVFGLVKLEQGFVNAHRAALAANPIGAKPGDFVEVEPSAGHNISTSVVVFLLPCVGLGLGYAFGMSLLHLGELASLATAFLGLAAGFVPAALMNRSITRSQEPEFAILKQLR